MGAIEDGPGPLSIQTYTRVLSNVYQIIVSPGTMSMLG